MEARSGLSALPIISLDGLEKNTEERVRFGKAMHDLGFVYLVDHAIPDELERNLRRVSRELFALPDADKAAIAMLNSPHFRGFTRLGGEQTLGRQDESIFDAAFADSPSTLLKIIRYPPVDASIIDGQGVGAHKDTGVLTLLWIEPGAGGLEIEHNGKWIKATPVPGALVVNIGELLEWATDGYLRATVHRVVSPSGAADRVSVPFFFNPALNARIPRLDLPESLRRDARGVDEDPDNPITDCFGANMLKSRLRAHPDVAARHHAELVGRSAG